MLAGHCRPRAGGAVTDGQPIGHLAHRHHRPRAGGAVFRNDVPQTGKMIMDRVFCPWNALPEMRSLPL